MKRLYKKGNDGLYLHISSQDEGEILKPINKYLQDCFDYLKIVVSTDKDKLTIFFGDQEIAEASISKLICEDIKYQIDEDECYVGERDLKKIETLHRKLGKYIDKVKEIG